METIQPNIKIIEINPELSSGEELLAIARGIEEVRRVDWVRTYANDKAGITARDIQQNFRPFEESIEATLTMLKINDETRRSWIAKDGDKIIGFCTPYNSPEVRLGALYIHPDYQGKGIGGNLIRKALEWFGQEAEVNLEVVVYNDNALNFYKHFGFEEVGRGEYPLRRLNPPKALPTVKMVRKATSLLDTNHE